jgi:glycosyltransferase involved in cell wall biosynthesis
MPQTKSRTVIWFNFFSNSAPSVRYRGTYLLDYLGKHGFASEHYLPKRSLGSFLRLFTLATKLLFTQKSNIVVIQRVSSFGVYARLLKVVIRFRKQTHYFCYDLDDAIYEEIANDAQIRWFMQHVHQVIVGSEELVRYAKQWNSNVRLITTPVVATDLKASPSVSCQLTLGFIGCYWGTHYQNMQDWVLPALIELDFPVTLEIIGAEKETERQLTERFLAESSVTLNFKPINNWMDEDEINAAMLNWDLGLAPLNDTVVCRAKSAFKVKQYLNLGIPAVSTIVGENPKFIKNGHNGFLYETIDELKTILTAFYHLPEQERSLLRSNATDSARVFQLETISNEWINALKDQLR